jgi:hypothetical protein
LAETGIPAVRRGREALAELEAEEEAAEAAPVPGKKHLYRTGRLYLRPEKQTAVKAETAALPTLAVKEADTVLLWVV